MESLIKKQSVGVVIPCFKVRDKIFEVLNSIDCDVHVIVVVDDLCPEETGKYVENNSHDNRITVIYNNINLGVGGAVKKGYIYLMDKVDVIVKIDGDNQMNPHLISDFTMPIKLGLSDYSKGNRFYSLDNLRGMPKVRIVGNTILSFFVKMSSGYYNIFDPTNGYTAISSKIIKKLDIDKISNRYFFESDMLFRLNIIKAVVLDIPMKAKYEDEKSNLIIKNIIFEFVIKNLINFFKRIFYNYYLRDFNFASIQLFLGIIFILFSLSFGGYKWFYSIYYNVFAPSGVVMLAALPFIVGIQFILSFLDYDLKSVPIKSISIYL
jgi:hypothetical protein